MDAPFVRHYMMPSAQVALSQAGLMSDVHILAIDLAKRRLLVVWHPVGAGRMWMLVGLRRGVGLSGAHRQGSVFDLGIESGRDRKALTLHARTCENARKNRQILVALQKRILGQPPKASQGPRELFTGDELSEIAGDNLRFETINGDLLCQCLECRVGHLVERTGPAYAGFSAATGFQLRSHRAFDMSDKPLAP